MEPLNKSVEIKAEINEIYAKTKVLQSYTNERDSPIELFISFPICEGVQLLKFTVTIGEKTIISKIADKEKAQEKYSDSIASGHTGILSQYSKTGLNQEVNIGNLAAKETVKLESEFIQLINSNDMSYEYVNIQSFPSFYEKGSFPSNGTPLLIGNLVLTTKSKITRLIVKNESGKYIISKTYNDNFTRAEIALTLGEKSEITQFPTLNILFRTEQINTPILYAQYDPTKQETSYILNYIYSSKNVKEIPIPEKPDEDESINYYNKYQLDTVNDTPGLFIFLIDQSGSMSGKPIDLVKNALTFFFQSLPPNSYFQLIGFGSNFEKYNEKPVPYNKENVKSILQVIEGLKANLGGTNISRPLEIIFNADYKDINLSRNIFLLTDGEVNDKEKCFELIIKNADNFRIHSIGLGNSFDRELIGQCGKLGKGSSSYVSEIEKVSPVVIECLNKCMRSYLINGKINVKDPLFQYPETNKIMYQDDIINFAYIKKGEITKGKVDLPFIATNPTNNKEINEIISFAEPHTIENGDILSKIIIGNILKEGKIEEEKDIELSKKYQILSKNTALYGEIKGNIENNTGELIKVKFDEKVNELPFSILEKSSELLRSMYKCDRAQINFLGPLVGNACAPEKNVIFLCSSEKSSKKKFPSFSNPFKKVGKFFSGLFSSKSKKETEMCTAEMDMDMDMNRDMDMEFCSKPETIDIYKSEFDEKKKSESILSPKKKKLTFDGLMLEQDIIEGFWEENEITMELFKENDIQEVMKKAKEFIDNNSPTSDQTTKKRILFTFVTLYYIYTKQVGKIESVKLIINKGKKYLEKQKMDYNEICEKIK